MKKMFVCKDCGTEYELKKVWGFAIFYYLFFALTIFSVLLFLGFIADPIFFFAILFFGFFTMCFGVLSKSRCPECKSARRIPANSPLGKKLKAGK